MHREDKTTHNWLAKRLANENIKARLPEIKGIVIDLGCGTAPFREDILQVADHYVGLDWSNTLHRPKMDVVADLNEPLPLADCVADHVISLEVIEHLAEPGVMLCEASRVLRPGGAITLSAPFQWWEHESPWDYQRYTRYGLLYQLEKAGFAEIEVKGTTGFWAMWLLKLNYQLARIPRGPRWFRHLVRALLTPFWWTTQTLAPHLDRLWQEGRESAGYFVTARKPSVTAK